MSVSRRALLIGVPEYKDRSIRELPVVRQDLEAVKAALLSSRYKVHGTLGADTAGKPTKSEILQAVRDVCRVAKAGEVLLLFFTGHGVRLNGADYLVPWDASFDDAEHVGEYLVPAAAFDEAFAKSKAETIVFFVDACREGLTVAAKAAAFRPWDAQTKHATGRARYGLVFSCAPGEFSWYKAGEGGFSLFSKALAEVLDRRHRARAFGDVIAAVRELLPELAARHNLPPQEITVRDERRGQDDLDGRMISDGPGDVGEYDAGQDPWSQAVLNSALWSEEGFAAAPATAELRSALRPIVHACRKQWEAASDLVGLDPWRDEQYPVRVVQQVEALSSLLDAGESFSGAEVCLLLIAPFVREAVLASAASMAADANPRDLAPTAVADGIRAALEKAHLGAPQLVRKANRLEETGKKDEHDAVALWLMHRALLRCPEVWMEAPGGHLSAELAAALRTPAGACELVRDTLAYERVLELARCIHAEPDRIERSDAATVLPAEAWAAAGKKAEQLIRPKVLAYLLGLAGRMALDVRTMSEVLVDHVGLSDPLPPAEARETAAKANWIPTAHGRSLTVTCRHPAVDLAFREHVDHAQPILDAIHPKAHRKVDQMVVLSGLPGRLSAAGIVPETVGGRPAYETPHVRFHLAGDKIRELLMGEQLYGDPTLAIRELYQNALDACRYRKSRVQFLRRTHKYEGAEWVPRIVFRQGIENSRPFIECEDNGIGMGRRELASAFARAGSRFADMPEFIEEQAEWLKLEPPVRLYPNSQFGVGVFSYFMLADELQVETSRLGPTGKPGDALEVHVAASGSLFRIRPLVRPMEGPMEGTCVRLFLSRTEFKGKRISCVETLRELLWIAEFETQASDGEVTEKWAPGKLRHPSVAPKYCVRGVTSDLWWLTKEGSPDDDPLREREQNLGRLLADGLATNEQLAYRVVNLRDGRRPKFTVNRRRVLKWDRRHASRLVVRGAATLARRSRKITFRWLWQLADADPKAAEAIFAALCAENASLAVSRAMPTAMGSVKELGCFPPDEVLLSAFRSVAEAPDEEQWLRLIRDVNAGRLRTFPVWLLTARVRAWSLHSNVVPETIRRRLAKEPVPSEIVSYSPGDSVVLARFGRASPSVGGPVGAGSVLSAARKLGEPVGAVLDRLRRLAPLGLSIPPADQVAPLKAMAADEADLIVLSRDLDGDPPWVEGPVAARHVLTAAHTLGKPIGAVLDRLQRLAPLGLSTPSADEVAALKAMAADEADLIVLSRDLDGDPPWVEGPVGGSHVLAAARRLLEPIGAVLDRLRRLAPLGLSIPSADQVAALQALAPDEADYTIMSLRLTGRPPWVEGTVPAGHVLAAARKLREPIGAVLDRLRRLAPLGLSIPPANQVAALEAMVGNEADLVVLSEALDARGPWVAGPVGAGHVLAAARRLGEPIGAVLDRLRRLAPLGLSIPPADQTADLVTVYPDQASLVVLSVNLDGTRPWVDGTVSAGHVLAAASRLGQPIRALLDRLRRLAPFGLSAPSVDQAAALDAVAADEVELVALSRYLDGKPPWLDGVVDTNAIRRAAGALAETPDAVLTRLRNVAELLDLQLPENV